MKIRTNKGFLKMPWSMEDTIENLRDIKVMMQQILRQANKDGKGEEDAKEVAFDFDRAIAALERQIPKKPYKGHYEREGEKPYIKYSCPNKCGIQLHPVTERKLAYEHRYCPKCGQALDWGNEE